MNYTTRFTATYQPQPTNHTRLKAIAQLLSIASVMVVAVIAVACQIM